MATHIIYIITIFLFGKIFFFIAVVFKSRFSWYVQAIEFHTRYFYRLHIIRLIGIGTIWFINHIIITVAISWNLPILPIILYHIMLQVVLRESSKYIIITISLHIRADRSLNGDQNIIMIIMQLLLVFGPSLIYHNIIIFYKYNNMCIGIRSGFDVGRRITAEGSPFTMYQYFIV